MSVQQQIDDINRRLNDVVAPNELTEFSTPPSGAKAVAVDPSSNQFVTVPLDDGSSITNTSQLVNDGENGIDPFITAKELPANLNLYATNVASDISGYFKLVSSVNDVDFNDTEVDISTGDITASNQLIASLSSIEGILTGNITTVNITTVGDIRRVSGSGTAKFYFEVYKRDSAGTETLISTSGNTTSIDSDIYEEFFSISIVNDVVFLATDRLVLKFYGTKDAGGSNPNYDFKFGGVNPVRTLLPIPSSIITTPPPISKTYTTQALMLADQANQKTGFIYRVGNDTWEKLATSTGAIGDYKQINTGGELEKITEGGNTGYRLKGRQAFAHGDIGVEAVDLSVSGVPGMFGATGNFSKSTGLRTTSSGYASDASNQFTTASGNASHAEGYLTTASGSASHAEGAYTFARSEGEHSGGIYGTDYTPANNNTDRLVNYGNSTDPNSRSNAWTLFKNGAHRFFSAPLASILNTVKTGFIMLDETFALNIHNGTEWRRVAFIEDFPYTAGRETMRYTARWILRASNNFTMQDTLFGAGSISNATDSGTSDALTYGALYRAFYIGRKTNDGFLTKINLSCFYATGDDLRVVVLIADKADGVQYETANTNVQLIHDQTFSNLIATNILKEITLATPFPVPDGKYVIIGFSSPNATSNATFQGLQTELIFI